MFNSLPNILLLISDNQRLDTLGALGRTPCQTPTWDRIAMDGAVLDHLRTTSPICSPARASLMTGLQPQQAGMPTVAFAYAEKNDGSGGDQSLEISAPAISHYLCERGYDTAYAGKWHIGDNNIRRYFDRTAACDQAERDYSEWCRFEGIPDGFVFHDPVRSRPFRSQHEPCMSLPTASVLDLPEDKEHNHWVAGHAMELFALRRSTGPYFAVMSMEGPHPPFMVAEKYYNMYDPEAIEEPANWNPTAAEPSFLDGCYYRKLRHEFGDDFSAWRKSIAVYWGYSTYIDSLFDRLIQRWEEVGLLDNTLLIMMSDHGDMLGQHGLSQKMCPYEEAIRIPCVMRWPGVIPAGTRCEMDISHVDLAATILSAGGVETGPLKLEGENLIPYLTGERETPASRDCFVQYNMSPFQEKWQGVENWRAVIRRPWKYVLHENGEKEFFNFVEDPQELQNLAGREDSLTQEKELHEALIAWAIRTEDPFVRKANLSSAGPDSK